MRAIVTGFPGLTAIPEMKTPGLPRESTVLGIISFGPTETPPEVNTMSAETNAFSSAFRSSFFSSGTTPE